MINKELFEIAVQEHLKNNFESALHIYLDLLTHNPENTEVNYLTAILYFQKGLINEGESHIKKCNGLHGINKNFKPFLNSHEVKYENESMNDFSNTVCNIEVFKNFTIGDWRHSRMVEFIKIFNKDCSWLTIGDFVGRDAWMLSEMGFKKITASNLYTDGLEKSSKINNLPNYLKINCENINLPDNSIDYILCKEALHHMPRPYLAVYEMLRVASKGIVFIEPQDPIIDYKISIQKIAYRELIKDNLLGDKISYKLNIDNSDIYQSAINWWESDARNYVYTLSKRETEKIAQGIGLPSFGFKCFNDYFQSDIDQDAATQGTPSFERVLEQLSLHDKLCEATGKPYAYIASLLFKETPSPVLVNDLIDQGFDFRYTSSRYLSIKWPNINNLF
jgi:hypothetical protein